jgi:anti-anti-sigma factor
MTTASIQHRDLAEDIRIVTLSGRLDMLGMDEVALRFTSLTAAVPRRIMVDLTGVSFLASIGIRSIIESARALERRGGRMVLLLGDNEAVKTTLGTTGIASVIPFAADEAEARHLLAA